MLVVLLLTGIKCRNERMAEQLKRDLRLSAERLSKARFETMVAEKALELQAYARHTHGIHTAHTLLTVYTRHMHSIHTAHTRHAHGVRNAHTHGIHMAHTRHIHGMHMAYTWTWTWTWSMQGLHGIHMDMAYARHTHTACTWHMHGIHMAHTRTAYARHTHGIHMAYGI